jgi:flavin-dependent dehydrogenase
MRAFADVGVVGGGPAGARVAEALAAHGTDVVLWDPKAPWEKPCGGGLTAALLAIVPEIHEVLPRARSVERVMLAAGRVLVPIQLDRPIHVIARRDLGDWQLARARAAGVAVEASGVRAIARVAGGWAVTLRDGTIRHVRHLVGADGAASLVRAAAAPTLRVALEPTRITYPDVAVRAEPGPGTGAGAAITLRFSPGLEGYAWDFPRPSHHSVGAVVGPGAGGRARLDAEIDALHMTPAERRGAVIGSALYPLRRHYGQLGGPDFALVGDAAGLADPATGEGITNAFRSATLAAEAFAADRSFHRYPRLVKAALEPEFRSARWLRYLMYNRGWAVKIVEAASHRPRMVAAATCLMNDTNDHQSFATMLVHVMGALLRRDVLGRGLVEQPE